MRVVPVDVVAWQDEVAMAKRAMTLLFVVNPIFMVKVVFEC
jgi:hypothetical protein